MSRPPFVNEPLTDFTKPENKKAFEKALTIMKKRMGEELPLVIGGEKIMTGKKHQSVNPANTKEVIANVSKASKTEAEKAIQAAAKAFETWRFVEPAKRAEYLFKAADIMRKRKHEFSACMVLEAGKNWVEADADTAEAIDFMEFYGREMIRYSSEPKTKLYQIPTEHGRLEYIPLGVCVVIPPWNFPNAIMCGMSTAAIVTGNTVVLKPASDTPMIAYMLVEVFEKLKLPAGVFNFCPGSGSEIGDYLVEHPQTRLISFTGSKDVGLGIVEKAAKLAKGQIWIKRVIAEMGGKDAIIVDKDADLEHAATGIVKSAFGFQGQKCSACSRAIIHKDVYDKIVKLIKEKTEKITVGNTQDVDNYMGPVCSIQAFKTISKYIETGKTEGKVITGGEVQKNQDGFFIPPTVIADVDAKAVIAQEEIFGPVLSVIKADSFDHALEIANDTQYGLTGSIYSSNMKNIEKGEKIFHVGNLYINRHSTGALVGVHPFGGFNLSGTDSKAGGEDYLLLFLQAKSISRLKGHKPF
ncbi:MAG: L-glutamate gamma-semialdehyde dehydrogenase [Acidobacteria bacterium]|nr:L-glutamate gamma-semialdehyde dehydrogenase [Acidobacteriota bacterium]